MLTGHRARPSPDRKGEEQPARAPSALAGLVQLAEGILDRLQSVLGRHSRKIWWFHSVYALTLGSFVVVFAQKGFERARWLAISIGAAWLLVLIFFRLFGSGSSQQNIHGAGAKARLRFFVMTYILKNLYQGMLFFLLPFYWKSATAGASNFAFVLLLGACALLSTLDIVFDRFVMRRRGYASVFHGLTIFGCLNLVIPALFPNTRTLWSLMAAGGVTVLAFWTLHVPLRAMKRPKYVGVLVLSIASGTAAAYFGRAVVPPVPMHLQHGAVGPETLEDGRLAMEVKKLHASRISKIVAVTDVVIPGGEGDRLRHVWRLDGREIHRSDDTARVPGPEGGVRLKSSVSEGELPEHLAGDWTVDVETEDGQIVGRVAFMVID
jgi:hypothetical protein